MKKLLVLILFVSAFSFAQTKKYAYVDGKEIIGLDGKPLLLRGTNLGNWLNPEGYMFRFEKTNSFRKIDDVIKELIGPDASRKFWKTFRDNYITKEDIKLLKELGCNHLRIPFNYKLFTSDEDPNIYYEEGFSRLKDVVKWCNEEKIYTILDMHAAPGGQTGDNIDDSWGYPFLLEDEQSKVRTIELWKKIASIFANDEYVLGYDLLNEPIAHYFENKEEINKNLEPLYKRIISGIREVDNNHIVFLGGAQWNTNFSVFSKPFDTNSGYTFHKYWMPTEQDQVQEYVDFREKYNVPIWLGESGENEDAWIDSFRKLLENNNIGWSFWPYKKMDSSRGIVTFPITDEWKQIVKFAEGPRVGFDDLRKNKPTKDVVNKALADLLNNVKLENCKKNDGYIKALGF